MKENTKYVILKVLIKYDSTEAGGVPMHNALLVVEVILGIAIMVTILMQPSKSDALSGLVQGSNNETFYSKNKARTKDVKLARATMIGMILFAANTLALNFIK